MDITFQTEEGVFNYRVCAVIVHDGRLLAMRDRSPYYYLPGGRVRFHETAKQAVLREVGEELGVQAEIVRPLWLNQGFFTEDVSQKRYHELCMYFLMDIEKTDLLSRGSRFSRLEDGQEHKFEWIPFEALEGEYLYPAFIKKQIFNLPDTLEILEEYE